MVEYKGTIKIGLSSRPRKTDRTTILMKCESNGKEYTIKQPDGEINLAQEKQQGRSSSIDDWAEAFSQCIEKLRQF